MSLIVKDNSSADFEPLPEGNYIARCYKMIDIGTQTSDYKGEKKSQHKIVLTWEILDPETKMQNGQPFSISKRYTASLNEKSQLFADLQAWRGMRFTPEDLEGFDLRNVLGAYCSIQVLHETKGDRTYENITAIMFTREKPEAVNALVSFDLSEPDIKVFSSLSERLQETIKASPEGAGLEAVGVLDEENEQLDPADFEDDLKPVAKSDPEVIAEQKKDDEEKSANASVRWLTPAQRKSILGLTERLGAEGVLERMELVSNELMQEVASLNTLKYDEAEKVIAGLEATLEARSAA